MTVATSNKYLDVFLSYRRDGGSAFAGLLHRVLINNDFSVFLDTKAIESGEFDTKIKISIDRASNFVFLLTPGSLRRCFEPQGRDFVLEEIQLAHSKRQFAVANYTRERADNTFRIIPIFLGDDLSQYSEFKESCPDVWQLLNSMFGDEGHNGVNLSDASSFGSEFEKLTERMLQKRSGMFVRELVDRCISDDDGLRQSLDELFSSYLDMYDEEELAHIRDHLGPLVNDKLIEILNTNDSEKLKAALASFRLSSLKDTCRQWMAPVHCIGSYERVICNLGLWLNRDLSEYEQELVIEERIYKDRLDLLKDTVANAVRSRKWMSRETLVNAIRDRIESDANFSKFQPANWKEVSEIMSELFDHFSYTEISEFFRQQPMLAREQYGEMQRHVWNCIQQEYKTFPNLRDNAAPRSIVSVIEQFLRYEKPYELCVFDCEVVCSENDDKEQINADQSSTLHLLTLLRKRTRGAQREYQKIVGNFLADNNVSPEKDFGTMLLAALNVNNGEFLSRLSSHGLSRNIKFLRNDWKSICSDLEISSAGSLDQLVERIRTHVFRRQKPLDVSE